MKSLLLSLKLFKKNLALNIILIIELTSIIIVSVIALNISDSSTNSLNIIKNSGDRIIYYSNPQTLGEKFIDSNSEKQSSSNSNIETTLKSYPFVKGVSDISHSFIFFDENSFTSGSYTNKDLSEVIIEDDETAKAIRYPLSSGVWFSLSKDGDYIPCVIGGAYSDDYSVGQHIKGYYFVDEENKKMKEIDFIISGKMKKPEQILTETIGASSPVLKASDVIYNVADIPLFIIAPKSLTGDMSSCVDGYGRLIYMDASSTDTQISELQNCLTKSFAETDVDLISNELNDISQNFSLMVPLLIMLLLISFCGVVLMCTLTTLTNIKTFSIYFITGCTRIKAVMITGINSLIYFLFSGLLVFLIMKCLYSFTADFMTKSYFIIYPLTLLLIVLGILVVCLLSFIVPFFILRKHMTTELLRMN